MTPEIYLDVFIIDNGIQNKPIERETPRETQAELKAFF